MPRQCAHWLAMTCKRRVRVSECKAVLPSKPAGGCGFCHWADVLANADTQQISACHCEERSDGTIRSPCSTTSQKAVLWANTKNATNSPKQHILAHAGTWQVSACHCEERSDVAIRSPCSTASQKAVPQANTQPSTNSPKSAFIVAFPCGDADCHRCAHWFAMTCKRRVRASECKAVGREGKCVDGGSFAWYNVLAYADTPHVSACHCEERSDVAIRSPCSTASQKAVPQANTQPSTNSPKSAFIVAFPCGDADCHTSSPQSPPCPAPAKGQSRATLPWVSFPHKACRFAGSRGYAVRRPAGEQRSLGAPLPAKGHPLRGPHALVRNDIQKTDTRQRM